MVCLVFIVLYLCGLISYTSCSGIDISNVNARQTIVWGPGLKSDFRVPVRYFFIQAVSNDGQNITESIGSDAFKVTVRPANGVRARIGTQVLDRHDGTYVVRYRLHSSGHDLFIDVNLVAGGREQPVAQSPYLMQGMVYHEMCNCPNVPAGIWARAVGCPKSFPQIDKDLRPYIQNQIDMATVVKQAVNKFTNRGAYSFCHYKVINNQIYRKCYGEHVGFKMFSDAILTSLTRKMLLPDVEFLMNLGDWPLSKKPEPNRKMDRVTTGDGKGKLVPREPLPILSWCGSEDTYDIVLPTYDLTEATLEMMGRVSLDIFSTQANTGPKWANKSGVAFWRGRDSRQERLDLVELSRKHPGMLDAALTNMFFFTKDEDKYGPVQKPISFFDFFKSKYQLNIDGTVAAYRLPYLLAGDSVVFKQNSDYYEHFYQELKPYQHYIPLERDLSDVLKKIEWARQHDEEVHQIAKNAQEYVRSKLNPADVLCYHTRLFQKYAKLLKKKPKRENGFDHVSQKEEACDCRMPKGKSIPTRDEL